jgi:hypothetical protein
MDSVQLLSELAVALTQDETAGYVLIDIRIDGKRGGVAPDGRAARCRTGEWGGGGATRFDSKRSTG